MTTARAGADAVEVILSGVLSVSRDAAEAVEVLIQTAGVEPVPPGSGATLIAFRR